VSGTEDSRCPLLPHVKQKGECPQGTKATLIRGTRRQTSQQSATSDDDVVDAAVAAVSVGEGGIKRRPVSPSDQQE